MLRAESEILQLSRDKMRQDDKLTFREAITMVCAEHRELTEAYRQEVLKSDTIFEAAQEKEQFTPSPVTAELTRLARDKMKRDGVSFSEALRSISREMPLLASDHRAEVSKSKF